MTHPYRAPFLAESPPPPPRARRRLGVLAAFFLAGLAMSGAAVVGAATWVALEPGPVALGPAALARLRGRGGATLLGSQGLHEPRALRAQAVQLEADGMDVVVVDVGLGPGAARRLAATGASATRGLSLDLARDGSNARVRDPRESPVAEALGLQQDDVVRGVDGWAATPRALADALSPSHGPAVIEVRRGATTYVYCVTWDGV